MHTSSLPTGTSVKADVGIRGEIIAAVGPALTGSTNTESHRCGGGITSFLAFSMCTSTSNCPSCGTTSADDYRSGTRAGARGGVTTLIDFAIPYAGESLSDAADNWMKRADGKALIDYTFHICITRWNEHKDQIKGMVDRGFTTFKEFMIYESEGWQSDDRAMFGTLEKMREYGTMLLVHAESARVLDELIARHHTPELMKKYGAQLHAMTRPNFIEAEAIQRAVMWSEVTGGQLYIVHMSTAEGQLDIIKAAQTRGVPVLAETWAQYLVLNDDVFAREDGHLFACCVRSSRSRVDSARLWQGLNGWRSVGEVSHGHLHVHPRAEGDVEGRLDEDSNGPAWTGNAGADRVYPRRADQEALARRTLHEAQHQSGADHGTLSAQGRNRVSAAMRISRSSIRRRRARWYRRRRWRRTRTGRRSMAGISRGFRGRRSRAVK